MRPPRKSLWVLFLIANVLIAGAARAEHFDITLTVEGAGDKKEAHSDDTPPPQGLHPRPVFRGRAGESLSLAFFMTYVNPHDIEKQTMIRYYLAPIERTGQKDLPSLKKDVVLQGNFVMDFKLKNKLGLKQQFRIGRPGVYLLRVESVDTHSDHQHFSALDLEIK